jgi:hypothetical protein
VGGVLRGLQAQQGRGIQTIAPSCSKSFVFAYSWLGRAGSANRHRTHITIVVRGLLNQPIFRLPGLWGTHLLVRDRKAKLELLLKHYGVELSDRSGLQKLAIFLALDHVPGMKVADFLPKKGAGLRWDVEHSQRFVELIDQIMSEKNCGRADAIRFAIQRAKSNKDVSGVIRFATERKKLSGNKVIEVLSNRYRLANTNRRERSPHR